MPRQQSKQRRRPTRSKSLDAKIHGLVKEIEIADAKLQDSRRTRERRREEVSALRVRLQGLTERLSVLQDLERRQEGISGGVRTILEQLRDSSLSLANESPWHRRRTFRSRRQSRSPDRRRVGGPKPVRDRHRWRVAESDSRWRDQHQ